MNHTCKKVLLLTLASTKLIVLVMDGLFLFMIGMGVVSSFRLVQRVWLSNQGNGFNGSGKGIIVLIERPAVFLISILSLSFLVCGF